MERKFWNGNYRFWWNEAWNDGAILFSKTKDTLGGTLEH
jgi:hypothetical protein